MSAQVRSPERSAAHPLPSGQRVPDAWCPRLDPRLPVLRRSAGEFQIGLEPERGLILTGLPTGFGAVLELLDGRHPMTAIVAAGRRIDAAPEVTICVVRALGADGLLVEQSAQTAPPDLIAVIGTGRLGRAVAHRLVGAGQVRLELSDPAAVDVRLYPDHPLAGSQAEALRRELLALVRRAHDVEAGAGGAAVGRTATSVQIGEHWSAPDGRSSTERPRLAVVCAETTELDRAITDALLRADQPHLLVRPWLGGAVIGPLVVPGRSPCLVCADKYRSVGDPAWPRLLDQLIRRPDRADDVALNWAAALVAVQVGRWLTRGDSELLGSTVELAAPDYEPRQRRWEGHPGCGCAWPVTAKWAA